MITKVCEGWDKFTKCLKMIKYNGTLIDIIKYVRVVWFFSSQIMDFLHALNVRLYITYSPDRDPYGSLPSIYAHLSYSVQFSHSVMSEFWWPHESQHSRPPCPSPTPRVHSNSRPSSQRCHPAISSSVVPFSSCPQSLPASEPFSVSQLFAWGGQSTGVSALASFLPKKSQGWSPLEWTGWISLQTKGL